MTTVPDTRAEATRPAHLPDRLRRAWALVKSGRVQHLGGTQYAVAGNVEPIYYVDLAAEIPCMCRDEENRGAKINHQCKHRLASRIAAKEPAILLSLIELMEFKEEEPARPARRRRLPAREAQQATQTTTTKRRS